MGELEKKKEKTSNLPFFLLNKGEETGMGFILKKSPFLSYFCTTAAAAAKERRASFI